jgi:hypothetical protein
MAIRELRGRAERPLDASVENCLAVLRDLEHWPEWASAVRSVTLLEAGRPGGPLRVAVEVGVLGLGLAFAGEVSIEGAGRLTLTRLPNEETDPERLELAVELAPATAGCYATAELDARVDVPRLLPVPGAVADQFAARLLADLGEAAAG